MLPTACPAHCPLPTLSTTCPAHCPACPLPALPTACPAHYLPCPLPPPPHCLSLPTVCPAHCLLALLFISSNQMACSTNFFSLRVGTKSPNSESHSASLPVKAGGGSHLVPPPPAAVGPGAHPLRLPFSDLCLSLHMTLPSSSPLLCLLLSLTRAFVIGFRDQLDNPG